MWVRVAERGAAVAVGRRRGVVLVRSAEERRVRVVVRRDIAVGVGLVVVAGLEVCAIGSFPVWTSACYWRWVNCWYQLKPEEKLLSTLTIRVRRDVITTYTNHPLSGAQVEEQPVSLHSTAQEKNAQPSRDVAPRRRVHLNVWVAGFGS
jgi:hypothetical protein